MAPELFRRGAVYSFASDLWALGVVLYECFAGRQPFRRELMADLQNDIETAEPKPLKGNLFDSNTIVQEHGACHSQRVADLRRSTGIVKPKPLKGGLKPSAAAQHCVWRSLHRLWRSGLSRFRGGLTTLLLHRRRQLRVPGPGEPAAGQEPCDAHGLGEAAGTHACSEHAKSRPPSGRALELPTSRRRCCGPMTSNARH